jgi:hypothetical protein
MHRNHLVTKTFDFAISLVSRGAVESVLVVVRMFVPPLPVFRLSTSTVLPEFHFEFRMVVPIPVVVANFAIIPVVVILVVAVVNPDANALTFCAGLGR